MVAHVSGIRYWKVDVLIRMGMRIAVQQSYYLERSTPNSYLERLPNFYTQQLQFTAKTQQLPVICYQGKQARLKLAVNPVQRQSSGSID